MPGASPPHLCPTIRKTCVYTPGCEHRVLNFPLGLIIGSLGYAAVANATTFFDALIVIGGINFALLLPIASLTLTA